MSLTGSFLGITVEASGSLAPWRDVMDLQSLAFAVWARLVSAGLGAYPTALVRALRTYVIPSILYGCELWGLSTIGAVLSRHKSPYHTNFMLPILDVLRSYSGFSRDSCLFQAPLYCLF